MKPKELIEIINQAGLSPDIATIITDMVEMLPVEDEIPQDVLAKVMELIKLDIEKDGAAIELFEAGIEDLAAFIAKANQNLNNALGEIDAASENMYDEVLKEMEEVEVEKEVVNTE